MTLTKGQENILRKIHVASKNNPKKPEFPFESPRFPASKAYRISVPGFENVWIKDESTNPTGTHKDRLAWEIVVTYRDILRSFEQKDGFFELPQMSIISSGSAAVAIQNALKYFGLPGLKVLVDKNLKKNHIDILEKLGCTIYTVDLGLKSFSSKEILTLTHNENGFDITSAEALDPTTRFYDWLSYEILNLSPEYCFIPFGTGNLFENILNINKIEQQSTEHDPRFSGEIETLGECHFIGVTTKNISSKATKLYSPHLPFVHYDEQWIRMYRTAGYCGELSGVYNIEEKYLDMAIKFGHKNNINAEPSGIASLGMFFQMQNSIPKKSKILLVNTGKCII